MEIPEDCRLRTLLEKAEECYTEMGATARKEKDFKGHPEGESLDAMMRSILQRFAQVVQEGQAALGTIVGALPEPAKTDVTQARTFLQEWGAKAASPAGRELRATRCFHLPQDAEGEVR
ncbi:unnamed protein product [Prorocentrum cordatum]|uniref:Uncharacterized protein n=1 Tax=Prorocentrum cordatum TaxID=2364126 RepID=A0ABN9T1A6_9DINO|nr:unnamed protein product [Polarella glacialis]